MTKELSLWVKRLVKQITQEWDWPVAISIDAPEEYQTSYQIFLTLKNLYLSVVILFDIQIVEKKDFSDLREKIQQGLVKLRELANERIVT